MSSPTLTLISSKINKGPQLLHSPHHLAEPLPMLTPTTLTFVLAYLQYYTPECLPKGRFISATHLRGLAAWIGKPAPQLRSLRQHPALAAHITLLHTMGYLKHASQKLIPQPNCSTWLHLPYLYSLGTLVEALTSPLWTENIDKLNLADTLTEDISVYLQQSLTRQMETASPATPYEPIRWLLSDSAPEKTVCQWQIYLPANLPHWLHFDLRQLGTWSPDQPLLCTPFTMATAVLHGYSVEIIQWILESAAQVPLPLDKQTQLRQWCHRAHTYQIRTVHLLSTSQPVHLSSLMRHKQLRQAAISQIAPRHLIVKEEMVERLSNWLQIHGYPLCHHDSLTTNQKTTNLTEYQWQWLCAKVLIDMGKLLPLPCPPPHALLELASQYLTPTEITNLEATAATIQERLHQAIVGLDAFFPAQTSPPLHILNQIHQAIEQENLLTITYQALSEHQPSCRQIQPLRLEQRGQLYYLHAYCYRAETNLTFRLDRIKEIVT